MYRLALPALLLVAVPALAETVESDSSRYVESWNSPEARYAAVHVGSGHNRLLGRGQPDTRPACDCGLARAASVPSGASATATGREPADRAPRIPPMIGPGGQPFTV